MGYPKDIKVIDCMMGIPNAEDRSDWFASLPPADQGRADAPAILDARAIYVQGCADRPAIPAIS
jgi:hypothetical protein